MNNTLRTFSNADCILSYCSVHCSVAHPSSDADYILSYYSVVHPASSDADCILSVVYLSSGAVISSYSPSITSVSLYLSSGADFILPYNAALSPSSVVVTSISSPSISNVTLQQSPGVAFILSFVRAIPVL